MSDWKFLNAHRAREASILATTRNMKAVIIHPLGYEDRPRGYEPDRFMAIKNEIVTRGHQIVDAPDADVVLFDSGVGYMERFDGIGTSPYDLHTLDLIVTRHLPVVWFDDFDHVGTNKIAGDWPGKNNWNNWELIKASHFDKHHWARFGWQISRPNANKILYFMRKMQCSQAYPDYVIPLEYPILDEYPLVNEDELFDRPNDVCGLANMALPRAHGFIGLLRDNRIKADCEIIIHYRRLEYPEWLARHRQAKLAADFDASLGSERTLRLFSIAPILRGLSDHRLPFPLEDMKHWVVVGDYDGYLSKDDYSKILAVVNDKKLLYSIYTTGAAFINRHYSLAARTRYVVDHIEQFVHGLLK